MTVVIKLEEFGRCPVIDIVADPSLRELGSIGLNVSEEGAIVTALVASFLFSLVVPERTGVTVGSDEAFGTPWVTDFDKASAVAQLNSA